MSKFFEALTEFEKAIGSYAEEQAIKEIVLKAQFFEKIRFVVLRELQMNGHTNGNMDAFGFEYLYSSKPYFKCRGIKFVKEAR